MKKYILTFAVLLLAASILKSQTSYNANSVAKALLTNGLYQRTDAGYANTDQIYATSEIVKTGLVDYAGNEIFYIKLFLSAESKAANGSGAIDSLLIVPDFAMHPMNFHVINITRQVPVNGQQERELFYPDQEKAVFIGNTTGTLYEDWRLYNGNIPELRHLYSQKEITLLAYKKFEEKWKKEIGQLNTFFSSDNPNYMAIMSEHWASVQKFMDAEMNAAKNSTYDAEINKIVNNGKEMRYFYRYSNGTVAMCYTRMKGYGKSSASYDTLKLHLPFNDNAYYDKKQFYSAGIVKNYEGYFEVEEQDEFNIEDGLLVPYAGALLVVYETKTSEGKKRMGIEAVIAPVEMTPIALNMLKYATVHHSGSDFAGNQYDTQGPFLNAYKAYQEMVMKRDFVMQFNRETDAFNLEYILPVYTAELMRKK